MSKAQARSTMMSYTSKHLSSSDISEETAQVNQLMLKLNTVEKDLERRQESYIARERAYKIRIDELEEEVQQSRTEKTGWMKTDSKMQKLKQIQGQILNNVSLVQDRTAKIIQEQERDLLKAFRARLFDVQTELEKEKSKKEDGAGAWIEKSRQLEAEVEWSKEVADRLERVNQTLLSENNKLKGQFISQEEDRNFLIKQLVTVKKENAKLRSEFTETEKELVELENKLRVLEAEKASGWGSGGGGGASNRPGVLGGNLASTLRDSDTEERYKDVNIRLRRLLADERRSLQQVRQNYAQELKTRTEIELLLRQCVDDVRKEIAHKHLEAGKFSGDANDLARLYGKNPSLIPLDQFAQEDRERSLELLLSQERVLTLLYSKTFPVQSKVTGVVLGAGEGSNGVSALQDLSSSTAPDGGPERPQTTGTGFGEGLLPSVGKPRSAK